MTEEVSRELHRLAQRLPARASGTVLARYQSRRAVRSAVIAGAALLLIAAGFWAVVTLPVDTAGRPAASPPLTTAPPSPGPAEVRSLAGTFFYHRVIDGAKEQLWIWTVGEDARPVADIGEPEDLAVEHYAWQTAALSPDGSRLAWVGHDGRVVVVDTATGAQAVHGSAERLCLPPVWSADGTRLLIGSPEHLVAWLDPDSGEVTPVGPQLAIGCGAVAFTTSDGEGALAYEDRDRRMIVAVTESGRPLWQIDVDALDPRLDPAEGLWRLVEVADGGQYTCLDLQPDVVGGAGGGGRWTAGNVVVDTTTGAILADRRPGTGLCTTFLSTEGYLTRVPDESSSDFADYHHQLHLTDYHGVRRAEATEPPELYLATLIGYAPAPNTG